MSTFGEWKALAKKAKHALSGPPSSEGMQELMTKIHCASTEVKQAYEDLQYAVAFHLMEKPISK